MTGRSYSLRLRQLACGIFYWRRASNGGVVELGGGDGLLIDTGADQTAAEALLAEIRARGWRRTFIINTHDHHDHTAGNSLLVREVAAQVLNPGYGRLQLARSGCFIYLLHLPGHTPDAIGIQTGPVFWAGDALFAPEVLKRFPIPAYTDVSAALHSLDRLQVHLETYPVAWGVAGHGRPLPAREFVATIRKNRAAVLSALDSLEAVLSSACVDGTQLGMELPPAITRAWLELTRAVLPGNDRRWQFWQDIGGAYARELLRRKHSPSGN